MYKLIWIKDSFEKFGLAVSVLMQLIGVTFDWLAYVD
jgi:hypothetical protein